MHLLLVAKLSQVSQAFSLDPSEWTSQARVLDSRNFPTGRGSNKDKHTQEIVQFLISAAGEYVIGNVILVDRAILHKHHTGDISY